MADLNGEFDLTGSTLQGQFGKVKPLPTFDAVSFSHEQGAGAINIAHVTANLANRLMLVSCGIRGGIAISGMTYNGVALTKLAHHQSGGDVRVEMWYLVAPAVGSHTLAVTSANNDQVKATICRTYYDVDQATPLGTQGTADGNSGDTSVNAGATASPSIVADIMALQGGGGAPFVEGAGQTSRDEYAGVNGSACASEKAGEAVTTLTWDFTGTMIW